MSVSKRIWLAETAASMSEPCSNPRTIAASPVSTVGWGSGSPRVTNALSSKWRAGALARGSTHCAVASWLRGSGWRSSGWLLRSKINISSSNNASLQRSGRSSSWRRAPIIKSILPARISATSDSYGLSLVMRVMPGCWARKAAMAEGSSRVRLSGRAPMRTVPSSTPRRAARSLQMFSSSLSALLTGG